jgi:hypothetical protein
VVCREDIEEGELIWWADAESLKLRDKLHLVVDLKTFETWPKEKQEKFMELAYQIDENHLEGFHEGMEVPPDFIKENFVNHSCDGNAWFIGDDKLVACRKIKKGEEIAYDYALTESSKFFKLNCLCGSKNCRKIITGDDWKLPQLQQKYGNHFLPYILKKIEALKKNS